jgi:hypothetical protein
MLFTAHARDHVFGYEDIVKVILGLVNNQRIFRACHPQGPNNAAGTTPTPSGRR